MAKLANALPLTLGRAVRQAPSHALPLTLGRVVGTGSEGDTPIITPPTPTEPPKPKNPFARVLGACVAVQRGARHEVSLPLVVDRHTRAVLGDYLYRRTPTQPKHAHFAPWVLPYRHCGNVSHGVLSAGQILATASLANMAGRVCHANAHQHTQALTVGYASSASISQQAVQQYQHCQSAKVQTAHQQHTSTDFTVAGRFMHRTASTRYQHTVPVPCRHYPIPPAVIPPPERMCELRPVSSRLGFKFTRKKQPFASSALPLPLMCWHDEQQTIIPTIRTYLVHNTITASLDGIALALIDFDIKTDTNSYCYSGQATIAPSDYAKIKDKLTQPKGQEPLLTVTVNGHAFVIIAEELSRSRSFANHSYTLSGRSITARLGADYAIANKGEAGQDSYTSQLVNSQLAHTGIELERYAIADWLIPANSLNMDNKTPIAVIAELAHACGGIVVSHHSKASISLLPRYKVPAWELSTHKPDVTLSMDVVKSVSDKKRTNTRYNTVLLVGQSEAGEVYRKQEARDSIAPIDNNALYTDRECIIPKGISLLSDSGTHSDYTLTLRWADKYNMPLAQLGEVWQVYDNGQGGDGTFNAIVVSVAVAVSLENNAPTVWQTVGLDRYMDV